MRNLKKVISSVAAMAIVASSASAFAVTFPDVDANASYVNAVDTLVALKIVEGDDNGLFNPDNNVTRAEFTKMAVGALNETAAAQAQSVSQFKDAANTSVHWAAGFVAQGVADGFINGMDDETFAPDAQVTYAQACKMLVAAIGYTSYAEAAGGWPTGYVSQASSLDITKGVSGTNDKALTRSECAVMIYNALKAPLCVIDEWETQVTLTGTVQTPKLKKLDGKEGRDYQTLLTDKHDAYVVKGRVTTNYQGSSGSLKKDEVKYDVEVADNYDDILDVKKGHTEDNQTFKVGDTKAADMLFAYTEAIVQKDKDADEWTILSIVNYGNAKTVEFKADDLADDDSTIGTDYAGNKKIPVYKGGSTSSTTKYDLAADAKIYVNGVEDTSAATLNEKIADYILANPTGTVQLVDQTDVGSTSTDGKYDKIMVTFYVDAVVDYVTTTSSYARIYFKNSQISAMRMEWDPEDKDIEVKFTKDGADVAYTDLAEFDVLSIKYNMVEEGVASDALTDDDFYDVLVSQSVVEGSVTNRDSEDQTVRVGGADYDLVYNDGVYSTKTQSMTSINDYELGTDYKLYLDAFGYVAHFDEGSSDKNYGVIVAMYTNSGDDYPTVRMISSDAKVIAHECKDMNEANKFYNYAISGNPNGSATYASFNKNTPAIKARILEGETVCTYKLSAGKLKFDKAYNAVNAGKGDDLEYKANSSKIGSYSISDAASKIIDMDDYMNNNDTVVKTLSVSDFEDEATYDAFFYDKNSDSVYRFAIVFKGTSSIRPESQLAVVKKANGQSDTDGTTTWSYTVLRAGEEVEVRVDDSTTQLSEGAVIAYTVNSDGYVDSDKLYVVYTPDSTYEATRAAMLGYADFGKVLNNVQVVTSGKNAGKYEIAYEGKTSTSKDVFAYAGVVYKKNGNNLELFTKQVGTVSSTLTDIEDISLSGATVYLYDYNYQSGKGSRVSVATATQSDSIYNGTYDDADKTQVNWNKVIDQDAKPLLAFVKEVDGDVTDCVLIQSK
ncbi:MAG: S-layer homology domain-containing protein [Clostridia bacterium]|nr:S-layer homology domain-containing protein [Clostridia bacterium]